MAKTEAYKSPMAKQYGAILVYRNRVISNGYNHEKSIGLGGNKKYSIL